MCNTCGCSITPGNQSFAYKPVEKGTTAISILQGLLKKNDDQAAHNRSHFDMRGILVVNLMSSPGSGKTALLEATIVGLRSEFKIAVIEGDLETENDAERIRAQGVPAYQIVTGTACHLDAHMVHEALHHMDLDGIDLLFIENVGNLVCPASFDLGQHLNVTLLSVTEGDDKPAKYPVMFRGTDAMVISKIDLLPYLDDFDPVRCEGYLRNLANPAPVMRLTARKGTGIQAWLDWLRAELARQRMRVAAGESKRPMIQPDGARLHASAL
jgi:hydrogenase nickel incorporation protein HypB